MKEELKEKYMDYQVLMQQMQQLQQNVSALEKHIIDLNALDENLSSLMETKLNNEVLMPLGSGLFVKGELKENKAILMNIGNNVCVEKTVEEAKQTVNKQVEEVSDLLEQLKLEADNTMQRLGTLQQEFEKIKKKTDHNDLD